MGLRGSFEDQRTEKKKEGGNSLKAGEIGNEAFMCRCQIPFSNTLFRLLMAVLTNQHQLVTFNLFGFARSRPGPNLFRVEIARLNCTWAES